MEPNERSMTDEDGSFLADAMGEQALKAAYDAGRRLPKETAIEVALHSDADAEP